MAAKLIQYSDDDEVTWYTLPGGSGELRRDGAAITDTVFGQTFESNDTGLLNWSVSGQAFYKGFSGYKADIKKQGTPVTQTGESMTLVAGKTYRIDDATMEIWDRTATITVYDNAVDHTADVVSYDYLFGKVTFASSYSVTAPVTIDVDSIPTVVMGLPTAYSLTQTANAIRTTDFETAQGNGGYDTFDPGLRTVGLELTNIYALASTFAADLSARNEVIVEINPDATNLARCRGFFKIASEGQSGDVGALEEETVSFRLAVPNPDDNADFPFSWDFDAASTLSESVERSLTDWINEAKGDVQYLADGLAGDKGNVVITECSLSGDLDGMNEFSFTYQGDGAPTVV